jgi:DNA-binding transcriptional ArsR family regulator
MSSKTESTAGLVDQRLVKALGHPLRQRILRQLRDEPVSPSQLSEALGEPLGNVSYHVKILAECEAIELVRTTPVRGAVEHFYRATALPRLSEAEWTRMHPAARRMLFDATLAQIWEDVVEAWKAGGFEDTKSTVSWTPLELDRQAYGQLLEEVEALVDRAHVLQAEAAERLGVGGAEVAAEHSTELVLLHFHRALGAREPRPPSGGGDPRLR